MHNSISPEDLISPPFSICTECRMNTLGILMITGGVCIKRCKNCWKDQKVKLPKIKKKIVYIDQLGISEMMKSLLDDDDGRENWKEFFSRLDKLKKLQLIH